MRWSGTKSLNNLLSLHKNTFGFQIYPLSLLVWTNKAISWWLTISNNLLDDFQYFNSCFIYQAIILYAVYQMFDLTLDSIVVYWISQIHSIYAYSKGKGKGSCLRLQTPWQRMFNRLHLFPGNVGANAACNYWSNLGSVHQVPITAGWTEAVWNTKFARHFYTWPALGIEPQTFWSWVQHLLH